MDYRINIKENYEFKKFVVLGAGGSFGIHTCKFLLENANPNKVIGVGRNILRPEPFSLNIDKNENFEYWTRAYYS